jgi:hypothetical protein
MKPVIRGFQGLPLRHTFNLHMKFEPFPLAHIMRFRLTFLAFGAVLIGCFTIWTLLSSLQIIPSTEIDLLTATVSDLQLALADGRITSVALIRQYLARIKKDNYRGIALHAIIELAPTADLIEQAHLFDRERASGRIRGPLHGIPILIKDNIATDPELGMSTTAGSLALRIILPYFCD